MQRPTWLGKMYLALLSCGAMSCAATVASEQASPTSESTDSPDATPPAPPADPLQIMLDEQLSKLRQFGDEVRDADDHQAAEATIWGAAAAADNLTNHCRAAGDERFLPPPPWRRDEGWRRLCSAVEPVLPTLVPLLTAVRAERRARGAGSANNAAEDRLHYATLGALGVIVLGNPETEHRNTVIRALEAEVEVSDEEQDLRNNMRAMDLVGRIGAPRSVPVLVRALFIQGKRRPVALQEIARPALLANADHVAVGEELVRAGRMQAPALVAMQQADTNLDPRLIQEQVAITLGLVGPSSPLVLEYLLAELDHRSSDAVDWTRGRGHAVFTPRTSKAYRRAFAARALARMGHGEVVTKIVDRLATRRVRGHLERAHQETEWEEIPGYIDAAADFLLPRQTTAALIPFALEADDESLRNRALHKLALQAGPDLAPRLAKHARSLPDCDPAARHCIRNDIIDRYVPALQASGCGDDLACWQGRLAHKAPLVRERAARELARLAAADSAVADEVRTRLLQAIEAEDASPDRRNREVFYGLIFALDRVSPRGCDTACLERLERFELSWYSGPRRSPMHPVRRATASLRGVLRARASRR